MITPPPTPSSPERKPPESPIAPKRNSRRRCRRFGGGVGSGLA